MRGSFTKDFNSQLAKIGDKYLALAVKDAIENVEKAKSPWEIIGIKKLKGHKTAYRMRCGNFRVGILSRKVKLFLRPLRTEKIIIKSFLNPDKCTSPIAQ